MTFHWLVDRDPYTGSVGFQGFDHEVRDSHNINPIDKGLNYIPLFRIISYLLRVGCYMMQEFPFWCSVCCSPYNLFQKKTLGG